MKKRVYYTIGIVLLFPLMTASALGLTMEDFREEVYRPENLPGGDTGSVSADTKVINIINFLIELILYASGSIAVLMLVYGGIRFITALGNTEQKEKALGVIKSAGLGLLVVIVAYALITNLISLIFKATT